MGSSLLGKRPARPPCASPDTQPSRAGSLPQFGSRSNTNLHPPQPLCGTSPGSVPLLGMNVRRLTHCLRWQASSYRGGRTQNLCSPSIPVGPSLLGKRPVHPACASPDTPSSRAAERRPGCFHSFDRERTKILCSPSIPVGPSLLGKRPAHPACAAPDTPPSRRCDDSTGSLQQF